MSKNAMAEALMAEAFLAFLSSAGTAKGGKAKGKPAKASEEDKAEAAASNDERCIKAFKRAGYKDVKPRHPGPGGVLTYGKVKDDGTKTGWLAHGRIVKKGEKAVRVPSVMSNGQKRTWPLFHYEQTRDIVATDAQEKPQGFQVERTPEPIVEAPQAVH